MDILALLRLNKNAIRDPYPGYAPKRINFPVQPPLKQQAKMLLEQSRRDKERTAKALERAYEDMRMRALFRFWWERQNGKKGD